MGDKSIQDAKEEWQDRLMAMPGVTGVGIGLTEDRRETCITVYVSRGASTEAIPKEIEGYPVVVKRRGIFRALG